MAGVFHLFGGDNMPVQQQLMKLDNSETRMPTLKQKSFLNVENMAYNGDPTFVNKPKGLSMRSQSDVNITSNAQNAQRGKALGAQKPTLQVEDNLKCLLTPRNKQKLSKLKAIHEKRKASPNQSLSPRAVYFKKPTTPRRTPTKIIVYPEPEQLSHLYDQKDYDRDFFEKFSLDKEFKDLMISHKPVTPFIDEGFNSDPEGLSDPEWTAPDDVDRMSDIENRFDDGPELPLISDDEDF